MTAPACRHFGECGGCSMLDVPYEAQLRQKTSRLQARLRASLGSRAPEVSPMVGDAGAAGAAPVGFRQKVSFAFAPGPGGRGILMGHFAAGTKRVVPVAECPVHSPRGNRIAFALRDALIRAGVPAAGPRLDGILRHLVVRTTADDSQAVAMLVVTRNDKRLRAPIRRVLEGPDAPTGFLVNVHDRPGPYMVGAETLVVAGRRQVRETSLGPTYLISPTAFFQTNVRAARAMLEETLAAVQRAPAGRVLDLYGGSGLFGLPMAQHGRDVTMIEENPAAVKDAEENRRLNGVSASRLRLVRGRVEEALARMVSVNAAAAVIDPPRDGCAPGVLRGVFEECRPALVVYVSCNPDALARDLPAIVGAGYRIARVLPVDMFPHTDHIEAVVTLERKSEPLPLDFRQSALGARLSKSAQPLPHVPCPTSPAPKPRS